MIIHSNEDGDEQKHQQQFADELTFLIAKYRIVFGMSLVSMIGAMHVLMHELSKSSTRVMEEDDEEPPMNFDRN